MFLMSAKKGLTKDFEASSTSERGAGLSDMDLVELVLNGNRSAFDQLALKYTKRITRLANRYTHNWQDAEDVAQESFERAYKGR